MKLFDRFKKRAKAGSADGYETQLPGMWRGDFFAMFIPTAPLFGGAASYKLSDRYPNYCQNAMCHKEEYEYRAFDTAYYLSCIKRGCMVLAELDGVGTLVFTNHHYSDLFQILQRHYKQFTTFVFESTEEHGYFKKLVDGKISRKIAGHLVADGMGNYPEVRGKPCEFELETGRVFRLDTKATYLDDMLKGFGKAEILALMDYYIGSAHLETGAVRSVSIYRVERNPDYF